MLKRSFALLWLSTQWICGASAASPPKLVVVIGLDQFRYDYLTQFREHFGEGGFNKLMANGATFTHATYKHALTLTGSGYAVISTGSYANQNGIIANDWYDWKSRKIVYCAEDRSVHPVGALSGASSPVNLLVETLGDALRSSNRKSKVISVSKKDRSAILMGGKQANGAYWLVDSVFISSTYYMNSLPNWVEEFNHSGIVNSYFGTMWDKTLPDEAYALMDKDDAPYEADRNGVGRTFPHRISGNDATRLTASYYSALQTSPFGDRILAAFAEQSIMAESLGTRGVTDLLWIGFSSNDYVGHSFGPNSHEVLDMVVQTDRLLADFLDSLNSSVGLTNCIVALTSDHGVAPIPEYLIAADPNTPAGRVRPQAIETWCNVTLTARFGTPKEPWLDAIVSNNIYLNRDALLEKGLTPEDAARVLVDSLNGKKEVAAAFSRGQILALNSTAIVERRMKNSFNETRSGDAVYALAPYYFESDETAGTTHGTPYDYDAHVPVIIMGAGIRRGTYSSEASPADIAPTLAVILGVSFPVGRGGSVLTEALK